jgi:DNA-3-methyladenine glycosylase
MFWRGGHLYVYFTYGMHFCANIVTGEEGQGSAVLLRALEPLRGIPAMARCRRVSPAELHTLCSGPAKLCEAFQIGRRENGVDLCDTSIWIAEEKEGVPTRNIRRSQRIGISSGTQHHWRFFVADSTFLSRSWPPRTRAL